MGYLLRQLYKLQGMRNRCFFLNELVFPEDFNVYGESSPANPLHFDYLASV